MKTRKKKIIIKNYKAKNKVWKIDKNNLIILGGEE